jgi:hypothetical protein
MEYWRTPKCRCNQGGRKDSVELKSMVFAAAAGQLPFDPFSLHGSVVRAISCRRDPSAREYETTADEPASSSSN